MTKTPFTVYAEIVPDRGTGCKFEAIRSAQRMAEEIYSELIANFAGTIASPGGSGTSTDVFSPDSVSDLSNCVAVKPSFGEEPDQVMIVGFFAGNGLPPYNPMTILHCGQYVTGPNGAPGNNALLGPSASSASDVIALKSAIEAAVTVPMTIIAIEVSGVRYGRGGYHFPIS